MSYAKFGLDGSDVYLYGSWADPGETHVIVCFGCKLTPGEDRFDREALVFTDRQQLLMHLYEHMQAGHVVLPSTLSEIKEDDWI